jgi:TetR/AcrR family transcriptional repressor of nem operon
MKAVTELIWTGSYGSTTVDQICSKAGVQKGSFYHFFDSKSELACDAITAGWELYRVEMDRIFSPTQPPLDRLRGYCKHCYQEQSDLKQRFGHVLGCPLASLGTEVSTQDDRLRSIIGSIMAQAEAYLATTIRDAQAAGLLEPGDPGLRARILYAYQEGLLSQARIQNKLEVLLEKEQGTWEILRIRNNSPLKTTSPRTTAPKSARLATR